MSHKGKMEKENVVHLLSGILFRYYEGSYHEFCRKLENSIQSGVSQTQKDMHGMY